MSDEPTPAETPAEGDEEPEAPQPETDEVEEVPEGVPGQPGDQTGSFNPGPTDPEAGYSLSDIERVTHNTNEGAYDEWTQEAQWHAKRQERILRDYVMDTWENLGGGQPDAQAQAAVQSAVESGLHALNAIQRGIFETAVDYNAAP